MDGDTYGNTKFKHEEDLLMHAKLLLKVTFDGIVKTDYFLPNIHNFWRSFARRPSLLLGPTLADLAEILKGCWRILWLCVVQVLLRSVEIQPS